MKLNKNIILIIIVSSIVTLFLFALLNNYNNEMNDDVFVEKEVNNEIKKIEEDSVKSVLSKKTSEANKELSSLDAETAIGRLHDNEEIKSAYDEIFDELSRGKFGIYVENIDKVIPVLISRLDDPDEILSEQSAMFLFSIVSHSKMAPLYNQIEDENSIGYKNIDDGVKKFNAEIKEVAFNKFENSNNDLVRKWLANLIPIYEPNAKGLSILVNRYKNEDSNRVKEYIMYGISGISASNEDYFTSEVKNLVLDEYAELNTRTFGTSYKLLQTYDVPELLEVSINSLPKAYGHEQKLGYIINVVRDAKVRAKEYLPVLEEHVEKIKIKKNKEDLQELIEEIKAS